MKNGIGNAFAVSHMRLASCFFLVTIGVWCVYRSACAQNAIACTANPHAFKKNFLYKFSFSFLHTLFPCMWLFFCFLKLRNANADSGLLWWEDLPSETVFHPLSKLDAVFETVCTS